MISRYESTSAARIEEQGFESTKVSDILKSKGKGSDGSWIWCTTEDSVYDAVKSMTQHNGGALVVVKPGEKSSIAGIITERDYLRKSIVQGRSSNLTKVGDIMTEENKLITVTPDTKVLKAMQLMTDIKMNNIIILNEDNSQDVVNDVVLLSSDSDSFDDDTDDYSSESEYGSQTSLTQVQHQNNIDISGYHFDDVFHFRTKMRSRFRPTRAFQKYSGIVIGGYLIVELENRSRYALEVGSEKNGKNRRPVIVGWKKFVQVNRLTTGHLYDFKYFKSLDVLKITKVYLS